MDPEKEARPDYGVDAPGVVRNLFLAGIAGAGVWIAVAGAAELGRVEFPRALLVVTGMGLTTGIGCSLMGAWMLWYSKAGKLQGREKLLDQIPWCGTENVLDAGCGCGLLLNGAARRLTTGHATGIDIWQSEDLSGNRPEAVLENARREKVEDRVSVQTADLRMLPFPDSSFDVVLSAAVIHNISAPEGRDQAISEMARVLKPGGRAVIEDIRHHAQYARVFSQSGCSEIRRGGSTVLRLFLMVITFGSLQPGMLVVRK